MEVTDSTVIADKNVTIVSLKELNLPTMRTSNRSYLLSCILPDYTGTDSVDSDNLVFDPQHINCTELQGPIDIQINRQLFEVPKVIEARLSPLLDNTTLTTSGTVNSLQERTKFIDDEIVEQMVRKHRQTERQKDRPRET